MGLDRAHYHPWHGRVLSPWWACWALVRVALVQVFRRKLYWLVLLLGLGNFIKAAVVIYTVTQLQPSPEVRELMFQRAGFSAEAKRGQETGYTIFMEQQGLVVMLLLALSGSLIVGSDFTQQTLPFYLSRRIDRRHYIVGKLLACAVLVLIVTTLPALILFLEYGMFTSSFDYWYEHWSVLISVLVYGGLLASVLSLLLVTTSAYLRRMGPIAIAWCSLFVVLNRLALLMEEATGLYPWRLIDPWYDLHQTARLVFGLGSHGERVVAAQATGILAVACAVSLAALVRRVRAVEIVQ
jgi:ABC-type transport system involved in multi-copper enzyme maturation permease subunit